jgi:hypothetical protein
MAVTIDDVERVLVQLRNTDKDLRWELIKEINAWGEEPLSPAIGERLLRGAAEDYPAVEGWPYSPNACLVRALWQGTQIDPRVVLEVYPRLDDGGRAAALRLLALLPSMESSATIARLLLDARKAGDLPDAGWPVLLPLQDAPRHPDVLVGPLARCLGEGIWPRYASDPLLAYAKAGLLTPEQQRSTAAAASTSLAAWLSQLSVLGDKDRWDDEYRMARSEAGLLLELLARLDVADDREVFAIAAQHWDPWIVMWGVVGLDLAGSPVPDSAIERAAADPEARCRLFEHFWAVDELERHPIKYGTQSALAESDMVRWLIYPTELGRAPDEIEEIAVLPLSISDGIADLYVYRFRTFAPHWAAEKGWMVGWSGPFLRSEQPTTCGLGRTFSHFEALDPETIDDYLARLRE